MRHFLTALWLACAAIPAQAQESIFKDYDHLRAVLDENMMQRNMVDVMRAFGASDEMTPQELSGLEKRVRGIFPNDFKNVDVLRVDDMGNGWRQELYAYWNDLQYIYAYMLMHDQGDRMVAIHFKFNTSFDKLNANF